MSALALAIVEAVEGLIATLERHEQEAARARIAEILDAGEMPDLAAKWEAAKKARAAGLKVERYLCSHCESQGDGARASATDADLIQLPPGWLTLTTQMNDGGSARTDWLCSPACAESWQGSHY